MDRFKIGQIVRQVDVPDCKYVIVGKVNRWMVRDSEDVCFEILEKHIEEDEDELNGS